MFQDNPVGKGTGFYQKKRLFHAKKGHASLVPLIGLYQEVDEPLPPYSTPSPPPEFGKLFTPRLLSSCFALQTKKLENDVFANFETLLSRTAPVSI